MSIAIIARTYPSHNSTPFYQAPGHPIAYFPALVPVAGSVKAAVLLCQLIYWTPRAKDATGWIYKSQVELMQETGLTLKEQRQARAELKRRQLIEERYDRLDHQLWLRVNVEAYNAAILLISDQVPKGHLGKVRKGTWRKSERAHGEVPNGDLAKDPETPPEMTTETPPPSTPPQPPAPIRDTVAVAETVAIAQEQEATTTDDRLAGIAVIPFEAFADAYPHHQGRRKARAEWDRQQLDATLPDILEALSVTHEFALPQWPHVYLENHGWLDACHGSAVGLHRVEVEEAVTTVKRCSYAPDCHEAVGLFSRNYCETHALLLAQTAYDAGPMHLDYARAVEIMQWVSEQGTSEPTPEGNAPSIP